MAASIALGCGGKGNFCGSGALRQQGRRGLVTRYIVVIANSPMQITEINRSIVDETRT